MCGIAGIIGHSNSRSIKELTIEMTRRLSHRGPDAVGHLHLTGASLGHRRLCIIDPATGQQPMSNRRGNIHLVFNGEIYNYRELKYTLQSLGHVFSTSCDTECIIYAYQEWGIGSFSKLRGMFAFALIDVEGKKTHLVRDHLGIKPLLYWPTRDFCAFSSEINALRYTFHLQEKLDTDQQAISLYLQLGYIPSPHTIYRQIRKVPPAHFVTITHPHEVAPPVRYWDFDFNPDHTMTYEEACEETSRVLDESVKTHLMSDVPFGAFLSGGIDSSLVVESMTHSLPGPPQTFSISFDDKKHDESPYSNLVSQTLSTRHVKHNVGNEAFAAAQDIVRLYGEPFGDSSALPTYFLCQLAREYVPMVLSGDGGDELFAGYNTYNHWHKYIKGRIRPYQLARQSLKYLLSHFIRLKSPVTHLTDIIPPCDINAWLSISQYFSPQSVEHMTGLGNYGLFSNPDCNERWARDKSKSPISCAQGFDLTHYLPSDILTKVDIASMAHGLEVRTPLVDIKVLEWALKIPPRLLITPRDKYIGKAPLKTLAAKHFGHSFAYRKKQGFSIPIKSWIVTHSDTILDMFTHTEFSHIDKDWIATHFHDLTPEQIWLLLSYIYWQTS